MNKIKIVKPGIISVEIDGELHYFSRYCTHEGADLSLGYVDEHDCLGCPWHNLKFDKNGKQSCKSLKNLKKYRKEGDDYVAC
jgi:nitrite reductase/ring-hydroxylating ferredoxin subunit